MFPMKAAALIMAAMAVVKKIATPFEQDEYPPRLIEVELFMIIIFVYDQFCFSLTLFQVKPKKILFF